MAKRVAEEAQNEVEYISLETFAQSTAHIHGVELMGGFYHDQERANHYADTAEGWNALIEEFKHREVK